MANAETGAWRTPKPDEPIEAGLCEPSMRYEPVRHRGVRLRPVHALLVPGPRSRPTNGSCSSRVELPFAEAEFDRRIREGESPEELVPRGSLAGQYLYLSPGMTFRPSRNFLGEAYAHGFVAPCEKSILLQCTCGITDCWFLLARITIEDDRVTWSAFEQFHRD